MISLKILTWITSLSASGNRNRLNNILLKLNRKSGNGWEWNKLSSSIKKKILISGFIILIFLRKILKYLKFHNFEKNKSSCQNISFCQYFQDFIFNVVLSIPKRFRPLGPALNCSKYKNSIYVRSAVGFNKHATWINYNWHGKTT